MGAGTNETGEMVTGGHRTGGNSRSTSRFGHRLAGGQKKKVARMATFCPAYGHTGSRRCRTDLGMGASVRRHQRGTADLFPAGFFQNLTGRARNENAGEARRRKPWEAALLPVLLNPVSAAMPVDRVCQARFSTVGYNGCRLPRRQSPAHGRNDFGRRGSPSAWCLAQEVEMQPATVGPDDIFPRAMGLGRILSALD
jgi:hypothetical protein